MARNVDNKKNTTQTGSAKKATKLPRSGKLHRRSLRARLGGWLNRLNIRRKNFLSRRPHRSFRMTRRRDYRRSLKLPGYWALTVQVLKLIWKNKKIFFSLLVIFSVLMVLFSSIMSQSTYQALRDGINETQEGGVNGFYAGIGLFFGVLASYATGVQSVGQSPQQITGLFLSLYLWLSVVWIVRAILAGQNPKARDGIYNSGAPVVALFVVAIVGLIQMAPAAISVIIYGALDSSGMLAQTAILMAAGGATILISTLSMYWLTSTLIAMVIVTLPGVYPFRALRLSGDIVTGRRLRLLLRIFWGLVILLIAWVVLLMPVIALDGWLKGVIPAIDWLPIVPICGLLLAELSLVFFAAYIYILYRRVVDGDS